MIKRGEKKSLLELFECIEERERERDYRKQGKRKEEDFFNEWVLWLYHQHQYQYQRQNQRMESFFLTETFPHNYYASTTITSLHLLLLLFFLIIMLLPIPKLSLFFTLFFISNFSFNNCNFEE